MRVSFKQDGFVVEEEKSRVPAITTLKSCDEVFIGSGLGRKSDDAVLDSGYSPGEQLVLAGGDKDACFLEKGPPIGPRRENSVVVDRDGFIEQCHDEVGQLDALDDSGSYNGPGNGLSSAIMEDDSFSFGAGKVSCKEDMARRDKSACLRLVPGDTGEVYPSRPVSGPSSDRPLPVAVEHFGIIVAGRDNRVPIGVGDLLDVRRRKRVGAVLRTLRTPRRIAREGRDTSAES